MNRNLMTAAVAVLALIALVLVFSGRQAPTVGIESGEKLLPALAAELTSVSEIRISGLGAQTTLTRESAGWQIAERGGYPADANRVNDLLRALSGAQIVEPATARKEFLGRLGLLDPETPDSRATLVELRVADQDAAGNRVLLGDPPQGRSGRYVRLAADPQSWLIDVAPEAPSEPADWVERKLLTIEGSVRSISRTFSDGGHFLAARETADQPDLVPTDLPEGRMLSYAGALNASARVITALSVNDVSPLSSLTVDAQTMTHTQLQTFDGLQIDVSAFESDGRRWIQLEASVAELRPADDGGLAAQVQQLNARFDGWAFELSEYSFTELTKGLDAYLQPIADDAAEAGQ